MAESAADKTRRLAGVAQGKLETERAKQKGPVVKTTNPETFEVTTTAVPEDEPQKIGDFGAGSTEESGQSSDSSSNS